MNNILVRSVSECGEIVLFLGRVLRALRRGIYFDSFIDQMYRVSIGSLSTTLVSGFFVGAIMAIQINLQLRDFGAQGYLGGLSTSVTIRNVGPVLIAFILSGKVGAFTSAELGSMQVTDQIAALRCLGVDPVRFLVAPRLLAVVFSSFLLLIIGLVMTIAGGVLFSSQFLHVNALEYIRNLSQIVQWWSVATGIFKSFFFGLIIGTLACFYGYKTEGGAAGVGATVRHSAVVTMVLIIFFDFFISTFSGAIWALFSNIS